MTDQLLILLVILSTSIIQSLFGVGVLLFGTPILLLMRFDYFDVLNILLPVSLAINIFQISNNIKVINKHIVKDLFLIVLPLVAISLTLATYVNLDFSLAVGGFLIAISISQYISLDLRSLIKGKLYLIVMAIIHGLTNLGGSLLAGYISIKDWDKIKTRTNVAFCYLAFAATQLITLYVNDKFVFQKDLYLNTVLGVIIFYATNKIIFNRINESLFSKLISLLLFIFGIILVGNYILI